MDCGPDVADQLEAAGVGRPEAILLSHEHGDHYLGLDDLEAFRRARPAGGFEPIPCYATARAWEAVEVRFGYLLGKLLEKHTALPGLPLSGLGERMTITPFKTGHGPSAPGSVGYVLEGSVSGNRRKLVYTSDFKDLPEEPPQLNRPDVLVAQTHWFNEPEINRPSHMSLQRLLSYVARWQPTRAVCLVHISDSDLCPGEPEGAYLKKSPPRNPLRDPKTGRPFPVPRCQAEWQAAAESVFAAHGLDMPVIVPRDGQTIEI